MRRRSPRFLLPLALACPALHGQPAHHTTTGFTRLQAEVGPSNLATGAGVTVGLIEAIITNGGNDFAPNPADGQFSGKSFTLFPSTGVSSGHATAVGQLFFGLTSSFTPGPTTIYAYEANNWLNGDILPAVGFPLAVLNHSWSVTSPTPPAPTPLTPCSTTL
jgi:hypothetical protein